MPFAPDFSIAPGDGRKNIIIVMDTRNCDLAVRWRNLGRFLATTGQRCTAGQPASPFTVGVPLIYFAFVERAKKLRVGNGLDADVDMVPASTMDTQDCDGLRANRANEGANARSGGNRLSDWHLAKGWFS